MEDPLPVGLGLRVQHPGNIPAGQYVSPARPYGVQHAGALPLEATPTPVERGPDGLVEFDELNMLEVCTSCTLHGRVAD